MNLDSTSTSPTPAQIQTGQAPSTSLTSSAPIPTSASCFSILPNTINPNSSALNPSAKKQKLKPSSVSSPLINDSISPSSSPTNLNVSDLQTPSMSITPKNTEIIIRREKLETLQRECAILMKELDISELTTVNDNTNGNENGKDSSCHTSPIAITSNITDGNNDTNLTASNTFNNSVTPGNVSPLNTYTSANGNVNGNGNDYQKSILKRHIRQLNKYNELKDVALSLVSLIADQKQVSIKSILEEMNVDDNDDSDLIGESNYSTKPNATVVSSAGGKQ
ncbi:unnamed protein product [Ambrosiozyma monospora]|uniref:Unnamed protein product n=1 Tax=Ambrosiozyma monospora TaxID=43982 RepID=A0A9W6YXN3_AMBMO|nr:unnamed protein product [Ambrosiozyma monospora]